MNHINNKFSEQRVSCQSADTGILYAASPHPLGPVARNTGEWLHTWAAKTPSAVAVAERSGEGWRTVTYGELLPMVRTVAAALLEHGLGPDRPIAMLSGNGVDHGLLALAAQYVGIPTSPVAEQYSLTLVRYANSILKEKMLFGSDWPMITPERWLADFEKIDIKDEVRPLILKNNAARLLGLG